MILWTKFVNWLNSPTSGTVDAQTAGIMGLATMTTPAATMSIVQTAYATPPDGPALETTTAEEPVVKVKKTRVKSTDPRVKKPRAPRKPKTAASTPA